MRFGLNLMFYNWLDLHRKFSLDDLLTNVMIYWTTGSIVSSMRFYKENLKSNPDNRVDAKYVAKCSNCQSSMACSSYFAYLTISYILWCYGPNKIFLLWFRTGIFVPTGLAAFPGELMHCPKSWAQIRYRNIYSYTFLPRGSHFAAFEEPQLLANDLIQFVRKVEKLWRRPVSSMVHLLLWPLLCIVFSLITPTWQVPVSIVHLTPQYLT